MQFLDRVAASADDEAYRFPGVRPGSRSPGARRATSSSGSPPVCFARHPVRAAGRHRRGTRYEWILADLAVMCAGGATTTVYPRTNAEDTTYILCDAECRIVFAEDDEQVAKLTEHRPSCRTSTRS